MQGHDGSSGPATGVPPAAAPRDLIAARSPGARPAESWLLRTGLSVCVWLLAGVATVLAASGQVQFAHWAGITDVRAYAVPAVLELVAVAFLLMGYRRARRGDSASPLWLLAAVVGAFSVYTNVVHTGGRSGLVFGAASAITLMLWFVKLRDDYRDFQRDTGQATRPRPKFGALWLVAPRLSARAWMIATRRRISTVDEAVSLAEVWRAVFEDSRSARIRRRLARRTAWRSVAMASGGVHAELPQTAEVAAVEVVRRPPQLPDVAVDRANNAASRADPSQLQRVVGVADASLCTRVYEFLDAQVDVEDYQLASDGDDPYLFWLTARALQTNVDAIAEYIRDWCRAARPRQPAISAGG